MAVTEGSQAGFDLFDKLEIDYEHAYADNNLKTAAVEKAISLLPHGSRVLDVGCGTGRPVAEMLAKASFEVTACDISSRMIKLASKRIKGTFIESDMLSYEPEQQLDAIFIIFSFLQLSAWSDFHAAMYKYASAVRSGGLLVIGTMPSDSYVKDESVYDETGTYVVDYEAPFMAENLKTFFLTKKGMENFVTSMGFEIVYHNVAFFQPKYDGAVPEEQQYIIAKRPDTKTLELPRPLPKGQS